MDESAYSFALSIPCTEEDMISAIKEIVRIHSDLPPKRKNTHRISKETFTSIRDNLQCLVDMMTAKIEGK